ncbi:FtsK/SpoIIIE domain-containing protein [Nocardia suismassiliense]|uniref:FtsK/SpoIIIE domain-containing protein n=1 Tax=Nocardia suismassiliense TaxID=2077092 RepID=UPI000D1E9E2D|nr:FtsK/SpoIIIE domain-containing protein [Nocardia suismassiliense]
MKNKQLANPWNAAIMAFFGGLLGFAGIYYALGRVAADFGLAALFTGCSVGAIVSGALYVVARIFTQSAASTRDRRDLEAAQALRRARYNAAMATIDDRLARVTVEHLADIDNLGLARLIWCALGLGHHPTAQRAGAHPVLYETDTDPGFRAIPIGVELDIRLPDEYADATKFIAKLPTLADMMMLDKIQWAGVHHGVHTIHIPTRDPLADAVTLLWPEDPALHGGDYLKLLDALRVGVREDGESLRMRIRGDHLLIAGVTGAGKSSALWSILAALGPAIRDGVVVVHMIDLKRGMEMAAGYRLYENFVWKVDPALELLQKLVKTVLALRADERREASMRTARPNRKHVPKPGDPHHVLIIDELMALLKIPGKRVIEVIDDETGETIKIKVVELAAVLLIELLTQARAIGLTVIMATQNAAKEVLDLLRDLIPSIVGMRLPSDQELMVFGRGAREQGVRCAEISADAQGTVFIKGEDGGQALRGRFFHVTDDSIPHIVELYGRPGEEDFVPDLNDTDDIDPVDLDDVDPAPAGYDPQSTNIYDLNDFRPSTTTATETGRCPVCGKDFTQAKTGRRRKWCSNLCKQRYHRSND